MQDFLLSEIQAKKDKEKARILSRFFKTGKGGYGEGDKFLGIIVPVQRALARKYQSLPLSDTEKLLQSKFHECRLIALFILILKYKSNPQEVIKIYLRNLKHVNNWDLVDSSAPYLLGDYLLKRKKDLLYKLAASKNLWERRIAVLSSFAFIKNNGFDDALKISEILLNDRHDLIHKAAGWMLREIGRRDILKEKEFLNRHFRKMPRTMLRYAVEKFSPELKNFYLSAEPPASLTQLL